MKTKNLFSLFVVGCAAIVAYNCSGGLNVGKLFTKKWQLESIKSKAMDEQMSQLRKQADTTKDSATKSMLEGQIKSQDAMLEILKSMTFEYRGDGTYQSSVSMMGQTQTTSGKWQLIADGKKVITTDDKKPKSDTLNIDKITGDSLTISSSDNTVTMTFKAIKS